MNIFIILVGFGLACAPVRCAHPSFWAHCHAKRGAARPPPIAASLLQIHWPKNINLPFRQYFGVKCTGATISPNFFRFFLFCIAFGSFIFVILFFLLSFFNFFLFISSYLSLLTSSYSSRWYNASSSYSSLLIF